MTNPFLRLNINYQAVDRVLWRGGLKGIEALNRGLKGIVVEGPDNFEVHNYYPPITMKAYLVLL